MAEHKLKVKPDSRKVPLPRINQLVEANARLLRFLNTYSSYHQVPLAWEDKEKTTFITPLGPTAT